MSKRLFIVAPHFPPSALPPSQRVRLMLPHLSDMGYELFIFTVKHKYREELADPWMEELIGTNFHKIHVPCLSQKVSRFFGFGDLGLRILPLLSLYLIFKSWKLKPSMIWYPVPPWNILLLAPMVKFLSRIPYGIDFIDPWVKPKSLHVKGLKEKWSQQLARWFEASAVKNASTIVAVSQPIIDDIKNRIPRLNQVNFGAIPYGVETNDFTIPYKNSKEDTTNPKAMRFRYVGAVWPPAFPVLKALFLAFSQLKTEKISFRVEFIGTSYAGKKLAKPSLDTLIDEYDLHNHLKEFPNRVPYKRAIELTLSSDCNLIFGDMSTQYAASKLMGLIASKNKFFAFLHRESYPYRLLKKLGYKYLVGYSSEPNDLPSDHVAKVKKLLEELTKVDFVPLDLDNPILQEHTAKGMTKKMIALFPN